MRYMDFVPEIFTSKLPELHGDRAGEWLATLPRLLEECASRFRVQFEEPFGNLSFNLILKGTLHDGTPVVVKFIVGLEEPVSRELGALETYAGRGGVQVIAADEQLGVLILEQVNPGTPLSALEDDNLATETFCRVLQRLHSPLPPSSSDSATSSTSLSTTINGYGYAGYPSIHQWFAAIERYRDKHGTAGPLPEAWVQRAEDELASLVLSTEKSVLLHGDLHHENILRKGDTDWAVIDPKGIIGDVHFEPIQFLLNYVDRGGDPSSILRRRVRIISECTGLDARRILRWGIPRGVLEACWSLEDDSTDWDNGIAITERFAECLDTWGE